MNSLNFLYSRTPLPPLHPLFSLSDAVHRSVHQGTINQEQGILLLMNGSLKILVEKGKWLKMRKHVWEDDEDDLGLKGKEGRGEEEEDMSERKEAWNDEEYYRKEIRGRERIIKRWQRG